VRPDEAQLGGRLRRHCTHPSSPVSLHVLGPSCVTVGGGERETSLIEAQLGAGLSAALLSSDEAARATDTRTNVFDLFASAGRARCARGRMLCWIPP